MVLNIISFCHSSVIKEHKIILLLHLPNVRPGCEKQQGLASILCTVENVDMGMNRLLVSSKYAMM